MINYGWRKIGRKDYQGSSGGTVVPEVSTELKNDFVLDCDGFRWALISVYSSMANALNLTTVYGTTFDTEGGQNPSLVFSQSLLSFTPTTDIALELPANAYGESAAMVNYQLSAVGETVTGVGDGPGIVNAYLNMQGERGLLAKTDDTGTGETGLYEHYYANFGTSAGPSFVAVPVGCFSKLQFTQGAGAAGTIIICANMIG